jgi:hypothetical protein
MFPPTYWKKQSFRVPRLAEVKALRACIAAMQMRVAIAFGQWCTVYMKWPSTDQWSWIDHIMQWSSTIQTLIKELSNHPSWLQSQAPEVRRFGFQSSHLRSPAIVRPVGMVLYHPKMPGVVGSTNQTYPLKELYNRNTTNHSERKLLDPSISPNLHISIYVYFNIFTIW